MKFCGKCGNTLDNTKKFCTRCGAANPFFTIQAPGSQKSDAEIFRFEKERIASELAEMERQEKEMQLKKQMEENRRRETDELARARQLKAEQLKIEQQLAEQKNRDEELARRLFDEEKGNTLEQIRREREKLKLELEEFDRLKYQMNKQAQPVKKSVWRTVRTVLEWSLFLVLVAFAALAGYFLYNIYKGPDYYLQGRQALNQHDWARTSQLFSEAIDQYNQGKLSLQPDEAAHLRKWQSASNLLAVVLPEVYTKVQGATDVADYRDIVNRFNAIRLPGLADASLPNTDPKQAVLSATLALDSFKLLSLKSFLGNPSLLSTKDDGILYVSATPPMNLDSELALIDNPTHPAIAPLLAQVSQLKSGELAGQASAKPAAEVNNPPGVLPRSSAPDKAWHKPTPHTAATQRRAD